MTSQKFGVLHVLVKTLSYNDNFDWSKVPKKVWKTAAKDYDEYLHLFKSEVGFDEFESSREKKVLQAIFASSRDHQVIAFIRQ